MTEKEFITAHINSIKENSLREFPSDFISEIETKKIDLPKKTLVMGNQFFGAYEITTTDGENFIQTDNIHFAKYLIYSNRNKPSSIEVPVNDSEIKTVVLKYENHLDQLIKGLESDYRKNFPSGKNSSLVVNEIFRILNLTRH